MPTEPGTWLRMANYEGLFWTLTWAGLGCALLALLAVPLLNRGMHGVK